MSGWERYRPAVTREVMLFLAGFVWVLAGAVLLARAYSWLSKPSVTDGFLFAGAGVLLALPIHRYGFLRIVERNIGRTLAMEGRNCVFGFIPWRSYLIIAIMVPMGVMLRRLPVPKQYLATVYTGIGLALILSSARYLRVFLEEIRRDRSV